MEYVWLFMGLTATVGILCFILMANCALYFWDWRGGTKGMTNLVFFSFDRYQIQ